MLGYMRLSENYLNNVIESCSSDLMTASIVFAVLYGVL